jgi:CheY-like chemotaxis protein
MTKVLVADDHTDTRRGLRLLLESEGFEVVEAADGLEAITAYARSVDEGAPIAGAILDHMMPHYKGDSVARAIRERAELSHVQPPYVAIYTGSHDASLLSRHAVAGNYEVFTKPDGWRGIVDRIVGRPAVRREASAG